MPVAPFECLRALEQYSSTVGSRYVVNAKAAYRLPQGHDARTMSWHVCGARLLARLEVLHALDRAVARCDRAPS